MKKIFYFTLSGLLSISVKSQTFTKESLIGNYNLTYTCSYTSDKYISNFKVLNNQVLKFESNYSLDTSIAHYKLRQHKKIVDSAQQLDFSLSINEYKDIADKILLFVDTILSTTDFDKNLIQSIFFHRAIIKTLERSLESGVYECLPHPGYFLNKTFFFDQRDYFFNKDTLKTIVNSAPQDFTDSSSLLFAAFINSTDVMNISFEKLYSFYVDKEKFLTTIDNILLNSFQDDGGYNVIRDCAWYCLLCGSSWAVVEIIVDVVFMPTLFVIFMIGHVL